MMRILLVGHAGCYNRGCEAIVRSTLLMLNKEFERPEVILASFDYENDVKLNYGFPVVVIPGMSKKLWDKGSLDWYLAKIYRRLPGNLEWELLFSPIRKYIEPVDLVLSIGGDNYTADYNYETLKVFLGLNKLIKKYRKKLIVWGASIGPFTHTEKLPEIVAGLNLADLITVREAKSFEYLRTIGVKNIKLVADPAFLLPVSTVDLPDMIKNRNIPLLGFNISPLLKSYLPAGSDDTFKIESIKFLRRILSEYDFNIVLIPHVVKKDGGASDDFAYLSSIYQELQESKRVALLSPELNAEQLKFVIQKCDYFIGARTHSTIAALSTGVPTLSIGYSQKSIGINEDLLGSLNYLIEIRDYKSEEIMKKFIMLQRDRNLFKSKVAESLPNVKKMSWDNMKFLKELIAQ